MLIFGNISLDPLAFEDVSKEQFKGMFANKMKGYDWVIAYEEIQEAIGKKPPTINNTKFKKKSSK